MPPFHTNTMNTLKKTQANKQTQLYSLIVTLILHPVTLKTCNCPTVLKFFGHEYSVTPHLGKNKYLGWHGDSYLYLHKKHYFIKKFHGSFLSAANGYDCNLLKSHEYFQNLSYSDILAIPPSRQILWWHLILITLQHT